MRRILIFIWLSTFWAVSAESQRTVKAPTRSLYKPKFLEKELAISNSRPESQNSRRPAASSSMPLARPWYAKSSRGVNFCCETTSNIFFHCSVLILSLNIFPGCFCHPQHLIACCVQPYLTQFALLESQVQLLPSLIEFYKQIPFSTSSFV